MDSENEGLCPGPRKPLLKVGLIYKIRIRDY